VVVDSFTFIDSHHWSELVFSQLGKKDDCQSRSSGEKKFAEGDQINRNSLRTRVVLGFETFLLP
jgi:hypothetical protein